MSVLERAAPHPLPDEGVRHGRLAARPAISRTTVEPGLHRLDGRALLHVPRDLPDGPARLAVILHGAGARHSRRCAGWPTRRTAWAC